MAHVIEPAVSARARCRGCGSRIEKGELRLGERLPNPFAEGEMTLWFHLMCGAYKRPEALLQALEVANREIADRATLAAAAGPGVEHRRLPRVDGAERAPTGRARCRSCRETIEKGSWRIALVYFNDGRFEPSGFIHAGCASIYLETTDLLERARHFKTNLTDEDLADLAVALQSGAPST